MPIWKRTFTLEDLMKRNEGTMTSHLGIEFIEIGDNFLIARMPIDGRTKQPFGIMHGGASCVLAETVGSVAANFCVEGERQRCVGLEINTSHIRPASSGFVYGKATPLHIGKTTHAWEILITDEQGRLVSVNRLRMAVITVS